MIICNETTLSDVAIFVYHYCSLSGLGQRNMAVQKTSAVKEQ